MSVVNYDTSAGGPSQGALLDQTIATDTSQSTFDRGQRDMMIGRLNNEQSMYAKPQLESSLGASGQYNSGAARMAEAQQDTGFNNQRADLASQFARTQMDMKRQEIFAGLGIIL